MKKKKVSVIIYLLLSILPSIAQDDVSYKTPPKDMMDMLL